MNEQARLEYLRKMRTRAALSTVHRETISGMKEKGSRGGGNGALSCGEQASIALENIANAQDARRSHQAPLTRVDLVPIREIPQPESTLVNMGNAVDPTSSFLTFWGVWFIVAAVSRFKRPLRRKRAIDAAREKALQEEVAKRKGQELQHLAALDHDLGRMATTFLQKSLLESEALKKRSRESSSRRIASTASIPPVAPADMSQFRQQPLHMKRLLEPQFDPKESVAKAAVPKGPSMQSRPNTRGSSFEEKVQVRAVEGTLAKMLEGKCVAGGLVRRVSQTQLAHFMFDTLAPKTPRPPCPPPARQNCPMPTTESEAQHVEDVQISSSSTSVTPLAPAPPPAHVPAPPSATSRDGLLGPVPPLVDKKPSWLVADGGGGTSTAGITRRGVGDPSNDCPDSSLPFTKKGVNSFHQGGLANSTNSEASASPQDIAKCVDGRGRRQSTVFQHGPSTSTMLLYEGDFFDEPAVEPPASQAVDNPMGAGNKRPGTVGYALSKRFDKNAFFEQTLRKLKEADRMRRSALELKRQYLIFHLHNTQDDGMLSCRDLMKGLKAYVAANQRQVSVNGEHEHRTEWFYRFFDGMATRCNFHEIEGMLMLMEKQLFDPDCHLGHQAYSQLVGAATQSMLLSPSVQFFLCRAAVAYGVPYLCFREVLELNHAPYLLQGDGSCFKLAPSS